MRLIFMGTPGFVVPVLEDLAATPEVEIVGVVTPPDSSSGRGRPLGPSRVKACALDYGFPVIQPINLRSVQAQIELAALTPDVIVVAAYGNLLPPAVLALPPNGCLNLHPSLLPRHRGSTPVPQAILEGDNVTGVALMLLDQGMDTGPLIARVEQPLNGTETSDELSETLFKLGAQLLTSNLEPWVDGRLSAEPQDEALATTTGKLERADGLVDWGLSAKSLERRSRAFTPWPGLFTHWKGKVLKLMEVCVLETMPHSDTPPGRVVTHANAETDVAVVTAEGLLGLKRIQLEGRRIVAAHEFLSGFPEFAGAQLV